MRLYVIIFVLALAGLVFVTAPYLLLLSSRPLPSDAAILFVGPDNWERRNKAVQLLRQGLSTNLIIPSSHSLATVANDGQFVEADFGRVSVPGRDSLRPQWQKMPYLENTHREALIARDVMMQLGLWSVNLVSSPYHMRRIKIIASRVFDDDRFRLNYVTAGELDRMPWLWWLTNDGWWWVPREYIKIGWFLMYENFKPLKGLQGKLVKNHKDFASC